MAEKFVTALLVLAFAAFLGGAAVLESIPDANGFRCDAIGSYPDPACTPGEVEVGVYASSLCGHPARERRNVTAVERRRVFGEYGVNFQNAADYEIDHFVPLCLGGSNGIRNLWPEYRGVRPGVEEKDRLEAALCRRVCAGEEGLEEAQHEIEFDWVAAWQSVEDAGR